MAELLHFIYEKMKVTLADQVKHLTRLCIGITHTGESNIVVVCPLLVSP